MQNSLVHIGRHYQGYKEEMIATGLVLVIGASASFFFLSQTKPVKKVEPLPSSQNQEQVLGVQTETQTPTPTPTPTPVPTPAPTPTPEAVVTEATPLPIISQIAEYLVADDQQFENDKYILIIKNIRMAIKGNNYRSLKVDVVLANKSVDVGLQNRLSVSIVKDGKQVASGAVMSVTESKLIKPGEKLTFGASISLIQATDVEKIYFNPGVDGVEGVEFKVI